MTDRHEPRRRADLVLALLSGDPYGL